MTNADRRALAAALRHGRTRSAFRPHQYGRYRNYRWYPKPFTGRDIPALEATDLRDGQWLLEFNGNAVAVDSVGFALSVLAFFGVYQPALAEVGT